MRQAHWRSSRLSRMGRAGDAFISDSLKPLILPPSGAERRWTCFGLNCRGVGDTKEQAYFDWSLKQPFFLPRSDFWTRLYRRLFK